MAMTRRSGASRLTRVDVLVLVVMGVLLLLMVGCFASMSQNQATRAACRANLARIGKAMLVYANEYDGVLPGARGPNWIWNGPVIWNAPDYETAYWSPAEGEGGRARLSSCVYLRIKYLQRPPKVFVWPADVGTKEFKLADEVTCPPDFKLADAWDFGARPADNCSYTYHIPFGMYGLTTSRDPDLAVAADRNPWIMSPAAAGGDFSLFNPDVPPYNGTVRTARMGNSVSHQTDGQNVLFLDGHASFEHRSSCGLDSDNIYTKSASMNRGDAKGTMPVYATYYQAINARDSLLVHEREILNVLDNADDQHGRRPMRPDLDGHRD